MKENSFQKILVAIVSVIVLLFCINKTFAQCGADGTQPCPTKKKKVVPKKTMPVKTTTVPKKTTPQKSSIKESNEKSNRRKKSDVYKNAPKYFIDSKTMSLITPDGMEFQISFGQPMWKDSSYSFSPFGKKEEYIDIIFRYKNLVLDEPEIGVSPFAFFQDEYLSTGSRSVRLSQRTGEDSIRLGIAEYYKNPKLDEIGLQFYSFKNDTVKFFLVYRFRTP